MNGIVKCKELDKTVMALKYEILKFEMHQSEMLQFEMHQPEMLKFAMSERNSQIDRWTIGTIVIIIVIAIIINLKLLFCR